MGDIHSNTSPLLVAPGHMGKTDPCYVLSSPTQSLWDMRICVGNMEGTRSYVDLPEIRRI